MPHPLPGETLLVPYRSLFLSLSLLILRILRDMPMRYGCSIIISRGNTKVLAMSHRPMMLFAYRRLPWGSRIHLYFTLSMNLPPWTLHAYSHQKAGRNITLWRRITRHSV